MATGKRFYWLKLKEDFFKAKEIKKLRKIAGGDTYTVIYLKLMLLSLRDNGRLYYEGVEETFYEELALEIDEEADNVKVTLIYLSQMGLMEEISPTESFLTRIPESVGNETANAELMRNKRTREKAERLLGGGNNVTEALPPVTEALQSVTNCYTEKDIEKDIEKDKDKDILSSCNDKIYLERSAPAHTHAHEDNPAPTAEDVIHAYNDACVCLTPLRYISQEERSAAEAILQKYTLDQLKEAFCRAEASDLLTARKEGATWRANFMWIVKEERIKDILNGKYDSWHKSPTKPTPAKDSNSTFDVDEFFARSLAHTYGKADAE